MQPIRRIDPLLIQQYQSASILARMIVAQNAIDTERAELAAIESACEFRKGVLACVSPFMAFAVLTWPLIVKGLA